MTLTQGHLNIKIKIMVFSEITWFGNYCSLIMRPETLQMQTTYEVNKGVKVCEYSRSRSFHDDLILQDQASGERFRTNGPLVFNCVDKLQWQYQLQLQFVAALSGGFCSLEFEY